MEWSVCESSSPTYPPNFSRLTSALGSQCHYPLHAPTSLVKVWLQQFCTCFQLNIFESCNKLIGNAYYIFLKKLCIGFKFFWQLNKLFNSMFQWLLCSLLQTQWDESVAYQMSDRSLDFAVCELVSSKSSGRLFCWNGHLILFRR